MKNWKGYLSYLGAAFFLWLFYKQSIGLNQALFGVFCTGLVFYLTRQSKRGLFLWGCMVGVVLLSISVGFHSENWARLLHFVLMFVMAGAAAIPQSPWFNIAIEHAIVSPVSSQIQFCSKYPEITKSKRKIRLGKHLLIYFIPAIIVVLFLVFYSNSNPIFNHYLQIVLNWFGDFTKYISFGAIFTFIIGLIVTNIFVFQSPLASHAANWQNSKNLFSRVRSKSKPTVSGLQQGLRYEYKAAIFLIVTLNILLFLLNIADIKLIWLGFKWSGQSLTGFVHEGTWYLIISILISVGVIVFYFRGNLNFYSKSDMLRKLAYLWLVQNAFLAISVGLRNFHYVEFYGLAYKRIGVFFFLAAVFIGLFFVAKKLRRNETIKYWLNENLLLSLAVLVFSGLVDWSSLITRYNLSHYKQSFVHMEFLVGMPDHVLPVLQSYRGQFEKIKMEQLRQGFFYQDSVNQQAVGQILDNRIYIFLQEYKTHTWQEGSYRNNEAYKALGGK